jgi:pyruvate kinase
MSSTTLPLNTLNNAAPLPIETYKRTKIIATVGPSTDSYEKILALISSGANGLRFNMSHGTHEERVRQTKWIRKAAKLCGKPVAIILDLQGPKVRLGDFEGIVDLKKGQSLRLQYGAQYADSGILPTQYDLSEKVKRGERLYMFDGRVRTTVTSIEKAKSGPGIVHVRVENDGLVIKRKGINLPDTDFGGDVITEKDKKDLAFGATQDVDYVAQSFVQSADDLRAMRALIKNYNMNAKLIVKFETRAAIKNMEAIVKEADMVMIARGDLAVEAEAEVVPVVQRQLIGLGMEFARPTIVATQMLASMTDRPEPTRAEVSDVATAVFLGADCVMLSDETANGLFPIEAVKIMDRVIKHTEANMPLAVTYPRRDDPSRQAAISTAVISLAANVKARAIVAETKSGASAIQITSLRPSIPLLAVTSDVRTAQQLAVVYNVKSYVRPVSRLAASKLTDYLQETKVFSKGDVVVTASGRYPGVVGTTDTIKVRVLE